VVLACFRMLTCNLSGGTEEIHDVSLSLVNNTFGRGGKKWSWPVLEC
jgi:hypothetical protein